MKDLLEQKLRLAINEAKEANADTSAGYEAGPAAAAGQCDGWVEALEWMLGTLERTFTPMDLEVVRIKYNEPAGGEERTYSSKPMMRWEAEMELAHEAELAAEGHERWPGIILPADPQ